MEGDRVAHRRRLRGLGADDERFHAAYDSVSTITRHTTSIGTSISAEALGCT
ncbi:hypothetical protein OG984_18410 [Nocardioides sp. NBC_00368]|uniref:hypothetical protein n=1 Tax=Nocardioides sp. NBC_00368 TaxID=2976000 RepID=UPI002E1E08AA